MQNKGKMISTWLRNSLAAALGHLSTEQSICGEEESRQVVGTEMLRVTPKAVSGVQGLCS